MSRRKRSAPYAPDPDEALVLDPIKGLGTRHLAVLWHLRVPGRVLASTGRHLAALRDLLRMGLLKPRLLVDGEGFVLTPAGLIVVRDMAQRVARPGKGEGRKSRGRLAWRVVKQGGGVKSFALVTERIAQGDVL